MMNTSAAAVGAGSKDAQRYGREDVEAALMHIRRLQLKNRSVLLQPYLARVDEAGETALLFFDGLYSHAIRKGPLLRRGEGPTNHLFAPEQITPRVPSEDEHALARAVVDALPGLFGLDAPLLYARIDMAQGPGGWVLMEAELIEPDFYLGAAPQGGRGSVRLPPARVADSAAAVRCTVRSGAGAARRPAAG